MGAAAAETAAPRLLAPLGLRSSGFLSRWLFPLLLVALVAAAFGPTLWNGFVNLDDPAYVYANPHVQKGLTWGGIEWAFTTLDRGFWHPLTWLSLMLDAQVFGSHAAGFHLTSLLLHAANAVLLFLLLRRLTGAPWRSFFVAALFATHPLHVESVAWVSERKDVLSTFFMLLSLMAYASEKCRVTSVEQGKAASIDGPPAGHTAHVTRRLPYWLSLLFFTLGLMSKAMVVTLPLLLLLLDWWPLGRLGPALAPDRSEAGLGFGKRLSRMLGQPVFREKAPFFILAVLTGVVTLVAQSQLGALKAGARFPLGDRLANAVVSFGEYLWQMVWPAGLAPFYPFPNQISLGLTVGAALLLAGISALALRSARSRPFVLFGWSWYVITLLPVCGLLQVGGQAHADRYTYVPLIGIFVMLVWLWPQKAEAAGRSGGDPVPEIRQRTLSPAALARPWIAGIAGGAVVLICAWLSWRQAGWWADSEKLFRHTLAVTRNNELAENNLGAALSAKGHLADAIVHLRRAVRLRPDHALAQGNLGIALVSEGKVAEAIGPLETAVRLMPNYPMAQGNLGVALLGQGRLDEALAHLQTAVLLSPDYAEAQRNLGIALGSKGWMAESIQHLRIATRLVPTDAETHYNLAVALASIHRVDEAIAEYEQVVKLAPNHAEAHNNLGAMLGAKGKLNEAIVQFREAVKLKPEFKAAQNNLRAALAASRR